MPPSSAGSGRLDRLCLPAGAVRPPYLCIVVQGGLCISSSLIALLLNSLHGLFPTRVRKAQRLPGPCSAREGVKISGAPTIVPEVGRGLSLPRFHAVLPVGACCSPHAVDVRRSRERSPPCTSYTIGGGCLMSSANSTPREVAIEAVSFFTRDIPEQR